MNPFDRWFGKSPPPAPAPLPGRDGEPRREEPAGSPLASTAEPPAPAPEPPESFAVPPGHQAVQVAVPESLVPVVEPLKGGGCVAFLGQGSDEPVEELEGLLRQLEPWMKDSSRRPALLSQETELLRLFGPRPSVVAVPRFLLWVFSRRALFGWLEEPANLQALLRHLYRLRSSAQPVLQFVCFEHDCGPGAAVLARLLVGLGLNVRVLEPDQRCLLVEVHRPDGVVLTALTGRRFPLEGPVYDFPASVNAEKARAESQGDVLRLWKLEQRERDYLSQELQPIRSQLREVPQLFAPRLCRLLRTAADQASPAARQALERELLRRTLQLLLLMQPDCKSLSVANFHGIGPAVRAYPDHASLLKTVNDLELAEGSYGVGGMPVREVFDWAAEKNISVALNVYLTPYTPTYVFWLPKDARLLAQGQLASRA